MGACPRGAVVRALRTLRKDQARLKGRVARKYQRYQDQDHKMVTDICLHDNYQHQQKSSEDPKLAEHA